MKSLNASHLLVAITFALTVGTPGNANAGIFGPRIDRPLDKYLGQLESGKNVSLGNACLKPNENDSLNRLIISLAEPQALMMGGEYGGFPILDVVAQKNTYKTTANVVMIVIKFSGTKEQLLQLQFEKGFGFMEPDCEFRLKYDEAAVSQTLPIRTQSTRAKHGTAADCGNKAEYTKAGGEDSRLLQNQRCSRMDIAWKLGAKGCDQTVAILDSGVYCQHANLKNSMFEIPSIPSNSTSHYCQQNNGVDVVDNDGFADHLQTPNTGGPKFWPHGTMMAGIVAGNAATGNGCQTAIGAAPKANLLSVRVGDLTNRWKYSKVAAGIYAAADNHASIINFSVQMDCHEVDSDTALTAVRSVGKKPYNNGMGTLVVAAGGRDNTSAGSLLLCPAAWDSEPNLLSVLNISNLDYDLRNASANKCLSNSIAAYGESTTTASTTGTNNACVVVNGTSMSTAMVSGGAAALWSHKSFKRCTAGQIAGILRNRTGAAFRLGKTANPVSCGTPPVDLRVPILDMTFLDKKSDAELEQLAIAECGTPVP
jgi:subtilisin family serine protease